MLQTMYSDNDFYGPGKFIPIDIGTKQNATTLEKLITLQKIYLENHRSITVVGVSLASLNQLVSDPPNDTLYDIVHRCEWIDWMTTTTKTETTGRIIFSTTSQKYYSAIEWIENKFLPLHHGIRHRINPAEHDGASYRVIRHGQPSKPPDDYSTSIAQTIATIDIPNIPSTNAWSKPLVIGGETTPSMSTVTKNSETTVNQQSTSTITSLESKIKTLSQTIDKLQQQLAHQLEQQDKLLSSINLIVEQQLNKRFESIQNEVNDIKNQYVAIADHVNKSWSKKFQSLKKTFTNTSHNEKEAPGSGSTHARKLSTIQRNLFQNPLNMKSNSTDNNKPDESNN